jgi:hypothetical protein
MQTVAKRDAATLLPIIQITDSFGDILVAIKRAVVIFLVDVVFRMGTALKCVCIGCRKHLWW